MRAACRSLTPSAQSDDSSNPAHRRPLPQSLQASLGAPAPEETPLIDLLGDEDELPRDRPPEGPVAGAELVALAAEAFGGAPARRDPDHWQRALSGLALSVADLAPRLLLRVMLVLAVAAGGSGAAVTDAAETLLGVLGDAWIAADLSAEEAEDAGLLASLEVRLLVPGCLFVATSFVGGECLGDRRALQPAVCLGVGSICIAIARVPYLPHSPASVPAALPPSSLTPEF